MAKCIIDVATNMLFVAMWIFMFAIIFQTLGTEIFMDDYAGMNVMSTYVLYTYRNTIGDI